MGFFDLFRGPDIHQGLEDYHAAPGAVLLDVRTPEEYKQGHIPGSKNIPLQSIDKAEDLIQNKDVPVFVYCHSGSRSRQAAAILNQLGFSNVRNIGGMAAYRGKVER